MLSGSSPRLRLVGLRIEHAEGMLGGVRQRDVLTSIPRLLILASPDFFSEKG